MTKINILNDYPVELPNPDIEPYATGNTGIPFVWRFGSAAPGPHVMISAIVHGNEPCGAIALDWLLRNDVLPVAGTLTLAFMNVAAYRAFDPADPNATRWVDEDMNRVWGKDVLEGDRTSCELERARVVRPLLDEIDMLFDIHSMQHNAPPLMMTGRHARAKDLARAVGVPERVVADAGHATGRRMRDYGAFDNPKSAKTALLIECGQHWQTNTGNLALEAMLRFLVAAGIMSRHMLSELSDTPLQRHYTVVETITIESGSFEFIESFSGGEVIAQKGTLIGYDGNRAIRTPEDNTMLVMPSKRLWTGQTAVRLAVPDNALVSL